MKRKRSLAEVCAVAVLALSGCSDSFDYEDDSVSEPLFEETAVGRKLSLKQKAILI